MDIKKEEAVFLMKQRCFSEKTIKNLGESSRKTMIRYKGKDISVSEAEKLMGREETMKALAYAAEHVTKAVFLPNGEIIVFNALAYILEGGKIA